MKRGGTMKNESRIADLVNEHDDFDEIDEIYDCGYKSGRREGYSEGYDRGYEEAKEYNVILDGEILDQIYDFKEQILGYRKEPWSENHEHNHMVFEIHRGLMELAETWVMNQVWDYWYKRKEELGD
jgi:flagellar biosynthesis/type III secretory pathway protein FliH